MTGGSWVVCERCKGDPLPVYENDSWCTLCDEGYVQLPLDPSIPAYNEEAADDYMSDYYTYVYPTYRECRYCEKSYPEAQLNDCEDRGWQCDECYEEFKPTRIPCAFKCGNTTTWDPTFEDLCYRCAFAENH